MKVVGITGGIASGKSTVLAMLRELGAQVIDTDPIVHQLMKSSSPLFKFIVNRFGKGILDGAGEIDRGRLGQIAFTDPSALVKIVLKDAGVGTPGSSDAIEVYADAGASNSQSLYFRWTSDVSVPGGGFWIFNLDSKTVLNGNPMVVNHCYRIDIFVDGSTEADRATTTTWGLLKPIK